MLVPAVEMQADCVGLASEQSGPALTGSRMMQATESSHTHTQVRFALRAPLLAAGVFASHRPETPGLGNYGNFWMTSDQKMNDFI